MKVRNSRPDTVATGAEEYRVVALGQEAARIVLGSSTVDIVRSRRAAAYHARQLSCGAEYVDPHLPLGARILPTRGQLSAPRPVPGQLQPGSAT
jgi:hypothetical protein